MADIDFNAVSIILVGFVLPMWIIFHYVPRWRKSRGLEAQDEKLLTDLWEAARRMEERLDNLERVLGPEQSHKTL